MRPTTSCTHQLLILGPQTWKWGKRQEGGGKGGKVAQGGCERKRVKRRKRSKRASKQARKEASKQSRKHARKQGCKDAREQGIKGGRNSSKLLTQRITTSTDCACDMDNAS